MSLRTNPDRILESIDRSRSRDEPREQGSERQAVGRELETEMPDADATTSERVRRIFQAIERAYRKAASAEELGRLAARFQAIGDISNHHARGDVSISVHYVDAQRSDDIAMAPFEIEPSRIEEAKETTNTSRADVNAMKVLREELRNGVLGAYRKLEPRLRDGVRERADRGHVSVQVTLDLRPAG